MGVGTPDFRDGFFFGESQFFGCRGFCGICGAGSVFFREACKNRPFDGQESAVVLEAEAEGVEGAGVLRGGVEAVVGGYAEEGEFGEAVGTGGAEFGFAGLDDGGFCLEVGPVVEGGADEIVDRFLELFPDGGEVGGGEGEAGFGREVHRGGEVDPREFFRGAGGGESVRALGFCLAGLEEGRFCDKSLVETGLCGFFHFVGGACGGSCRGGLAAGRQYRVVGLGDFVGDRLVGGIESEVRRERDFF